MNRRRHASADARGMRVASPDGRREAVPETSPAYFFGVIAFVVAWIGIDTWGRAAGWRHMEAPPYFWLQGVVSLNALLVTVAVLIRQNRMSELAEHRAHLDLQINMLTEQKVTKILEILDRRGVGAAAAHAQVEDDLTTPADPAALLDAIKKSADI
jgi:uncharacterized membrane protein